jgi:membrane-bound lytic murein transglycosylase D
MRHHSLLDSRAPWRRSVSVVRSVPAVFVTSLLLLISACASTGTTDAPGVLSAGAPLAGGVAESGVTPQPTEAEAEAAQTANIVSEAEIDKAIASVDDEGTAEGQIGDEISHATSEKIPMEVNAAVEKWLGYFSARDRERFQRFMERGERYKPVIHAVLKDQGVPTELYYQAMIESGFSTHATSHARAVGIWQFIPATGRRYGLRIDRYVDERRDPMRASVAAALYLKDLYNVFQSWYLAMAAYNAGEGRILGAIMRANTRDFWEMVRLGALPAETMDYIPKFLAATTIGHDPERYGFDELASEVSPPLIAVTVPSPVKLTDVARLSGMPLDVLKDHNPHLLQGVTPPGASTYRLWIPRDQAPDVEAQVDALAGLRISNLRYVAQADSATGGGASARKHTVRRGETLGKIAARYGTTVRELKRLNSLRSNQIRLGTRLSVPQAPGKSASRSSAALRPGASAAAKAAALQRYRVQRGDDLTVIARRFGLSVPELKRLNRLKHNTIYVGQTLKVGPRQG